MSEILDTAEPVKPAATEAPATEPTAWIGNTDAFRDGAPDKVVQLLETKKWNNAEQIVDAYLELEKFKGIGDHLVIPEAEDADGWEDVYSKLGRPEAPDKYELAVDGDIELSEDLTGAFKEFAHKQGLTQKQFNEIVAFQIDAVTSQEQAYAEQMEQQKQANIERLKLKLGVAFESKVRMARQTADRLGIFQTLEAKGLTSDADVIEMLIDIAEKSAEDVITQTPPQQPQKTAAEQIKDIKANPAFLDKFHPDHKAVMAEFMKLNQMVANLGQSQAPSSR